MVDTTGSVAPDGQPQVDVGKLSDVNAEKRTTVPVPGTVAAGAVRDEGSLLPGEKGAPPIASYDPAAYRDPDLADHEAPFASPPPPDPGMPAGMSVLPGSKDTLPVAPGTVIPSAKKGEPGPLGNDPSVVPA